MHCIQGNFFLKHAKLSKEAINYINAKHKTFTFNDSLPI